LSVIAGARTLIGDVESRLSALAGDSLVSIVFLRDFPLPDGSRSLSYRLTVGSTDRTLSSEEVAAVRSRIIEGMRQAGYELKV
jgi:phenylalanyl-tRNA synthetase beta subunit